MKNTHEEFLVELANRLRSHANYFDEAHEYGRMKDLDDAYHVIISLSNGIKSIGDAIESRMKARQFE